MIENAATTPTNFIREAILEDIRTGRFGGRVHTRFPPEPNGYLHIGHAKAFYVDFGMAEAFGGLCNLRYDDTNPVKEDVEYVESIKEDIKWMGFTWDDREFYASDYFEQLYQYAVQLIKKGKAYICDLNVDEIREYRGTLTEPGKNSPYRDRSVEENLDLFERMRAGEFPEGARTLRAKIDMASPNLNMRDPVMYRIIHTSHHRTGNAWCIYPMYDFTHGLCDSIEGVTHSLCSIEYVDHRPLYDWFLDALDVYHPQQIEFARLNMTYTVMSKRKLRKLVNEGVVEGWDDPRMPTLSGMRRRGYTPQAIRDFLDRIGVSKTNSVVDVELLEHSVRDDLEKRSPRAMAVLDPLRVVIENYPEGKVEEFDIPVYTQDPERKETRKVPFSRVIYIEREDFMEEPSKKFFRLAPGKEVRLMHAYYVTCTGVVKDKAGNIIEVRCTHDPESRGGMSTDGRRVQGTLHWVSAEHAITAEIRLYEKLFTTPNPEDTEEGADFLSNIAPNSKTTLTHCYIEPALANTKVGTTFQFLRKGYFCLDPDSKPGSLVFNRTISLKDSWSKIQAKS